MQHSYSNGFMINVPVIPEKCTFLCKLFLSAIEFNILYNILLEIKKKYRNLFAIIKI